MKMLELTLAAFAHFVARVTLLATIVAMSLALPARNALAAHAELSGQAAQTAHAALSAQVAQVAPAAPPARPVQTNLTPRATEGGARIKDIARVQGNRSHALVGYGIVSGLAGTGDSASNRTTKQTLSNLLAQF